MMNAKKLLVVIAGAAMPFVGNAASVALWTSSPYNHAAPGSEAVSLTPYDGSMGTLLGVQLAISGGVGGSLTLVAPPGVNQSFTVSLSGSVSGIGHGLMAAGAGAIAPNPTIVPVAAGVTYVAPVGFPISGVSAWQSPANAVWSTGPITVNVADLVDWNVASASGDGTGDVSGLTSAGVVEMWIEVVPEPHEYALFAGLGMLGFMAIRRRLRR
jgi:hypothetical protein